MGLAAELSIKEGRPVELGNAAVGVRS